MDSRLRTITIAACVGVVMFVLVIVLYVNRDLFGGKGTRKDSGALISASEDNGEKAVAEKTEEGYWIGDDLSAFKEDESFFDKEATKYDEYVKKHKTLSMITTSVEKDLRIKIVDYDGKVLEDKELSVTIEGKGDYKDTDKDGIIYIPYIKAGEYKVTLNEVEGYTVPEEPLIVNIKAQVEYVPIEDIKALIKTEAEIDPSKDDKDYLDMDADTDKT